jgi:hypothetical protein
MLQPLSELQSYTAHARDGDIGRVQDFWFDDHKWTVRYIQVDTKLATRKRLFGTRPRNVSRPLDHSGNRQPVSLSPISIREIRSDRKWLFVDHSQKQILNSPRLDLLQGVSRQDEATLNKHFNLPHYWAGPELWGDHSFPQQDVVVDPESELFKHHPEKHEFSPPKKDPEPHLRSTQELKQYEAHAADGSLGRIEDYLIEEATWTIRYVLINTVDTLTVPYALISPAWINRILWKNKHLSVNADLNSLQSAPAYRPGDVLTHDFEEALFTHYGRTPYWV